MTVKAPEPSEAQLVKQLELPNELQDFVTRVSKWTASLLNPYLEQLSHFGDGEVLGKKEFNDGVWGTVVLKPAEVVVLDSPLLQRLRHTRQLGVVHLVYPSATHTRLDHSIGTVHQIAALCSGVNRNDELIDQKHCDLLRLAALCHDVGHGFMSHVSENAMENISSVRQLKREFSEKTRREIRKLSEIAAYYMIDSESFRTLISEAKRITDTHELPQNEVDMIRDAIVGIPISNSVPLLHELLSGPFDADKLDYMTRDARMTGVPVVTDIPRLVQKVRGRALQLSDLPEDVKKQVTVGEPTYVLTGIALSGGRTLDELMFGQTLLFDKLYRHQKVRAAEAMVASILDQIGGLCSQGEVLSPYALTDADVYGLDMDRVENFAGRELNDDEAKRAEISIDISQRLAERRLFRRAYAFAQNMPLDPFHADTEHYSGLVALAADSRKPKTRGKLAQAIVHETQRVLELLDLNDVCDRCPGGDITPYVWIDPPNVSTQGNDTERSYLVSDSRVGQSFLRFKDEYAETTGWSNAYLLTRDTGYIFTIEGLTLPVYLAAEKVARRDYGIRTPRSMLAYSKQDPAKVVEAKRTLESKGFYEGVPFDIRPVPERFERGDHVERLQGVVDAFMGYQGPVRDGQEEKKATVMSDRRIEAWALQFGSEFADDALSLAERLQMVGRDQVVSALKDFLDGPGGTFESGSVTPLGDAKDSSALTTYFAGDANRLKIRGLAEALRAEKPIVFAEDFVGSGAQTISILESLLGVAQTTDLHEERESALSDHLLAEFKERELAIVYAAGTPQGAKAVEDAGARLGLKLEVHLFQDANPQAFVNGTDTPFAKRCHEIGTALLLDPATGHDEAWVEQRALGYGNDGYLVVFPYNTPTQSLTCLWKDGSVNGTPWLPLIPRRPKH